MVEVNRENGGNLVRHRIGADGRISNESKVTDLNERKKKMILRSNQSSKIKEILRADKLNAKKIETKQ